MRDADDARCPLPEHYGLAAVEPLQSLPFGCDCNGTELKYDDMRSWFWRPLADAYHAVWTGRVLDRSAKLSKGMRFVWTLLLGHDAGLLEPPPIALRALPVDASDAERQAAALFALLAGLRFAVGENALPMPFGVTLVQDYCHLSRGTAHDAIKGIVAAGVIVKAGEEKPRGRHAHGTYLYEPGRT